ncbi:flagellar export protein FliJ [Lentibacillus sp. CBA3610]|uniref:flagellar export protein FliJ n=1 Tax=Lentibacillus sp. CBA3610 TaxID=2518176 RepID=UPI001595391D|nr:flagellar export protein FliJ [Lentibacillus sp. CBA3610]QKY69033.1 flagellar export protein FliJ [Lentibacillus sp. CBA3610]
MAGTAALSKVLHIRENEKTRAQKAYQKSIDDFEEVATQLYELLRKKEAAESLYETYLQQSSPIGKIREQALYIENLKKQIIALQQEVQHARSEMESKHEDLSEAYVEVKKFEKVIEHREEEAAALIKKDEKDSMDEISIRQYLSRKTGD